MLICVFVLFVRTKKKNRKKRNVPTMLSIGAVRWCVKPVWFTGDQFSHIFVKKGFKTALMILLYYYYCEGTYLVKEFPHNLCLCFDTAFLQGVIKVTGNTFAEIVAGYGLQNDDSKTQPFRIYLSHLQLFLSFMVNLFI